MDLPEAHTDRNRGLPLEQDHPSVRLLRPSLPFNDPGHRGSLDATVTSKDDMGLPLPASPGMTLERQGDGPAAHPPQVAPNVGLEDISTGVVMSDGRKTDEHTKMTLHLQQLSGSHDDMSSAHRIHMMTDAGRWRQDMHSDAAHIDVAQASSRTDW